MHSPTLRPPVIKRRDECFTSVIRWGLLVWAILRLIVSVLLTGKMIFKTIEIMILLQHEEKTEANYGHYLLTNLWIYVHSTLVQLVEFGMLVTFIIAGIRKSARLYHAYYRYCILTLVIYIVAVILCVTLDYFGYEHHFINIYLTYHYIATWPIFRGIYFNVAFILVAVFDVGLEILLIVSIKKLIKTYSFTPPVNIVHSPPLVI